ncbi:MAG: BON domain-containing protein [Candidatus Saccharimonas sp.]|nr:BON domain-containing protein [Planctomycetaceae bacterium]
MILSASPKHLHRNQELGSLVERELKAVDSQRFRRVTVQVLFCGIVELDGVVTTYYAKSLALQTIRRLPGVSDVVDLLRVDPRSEDRAAFAGCR